MINNFDSLYNKAIQIKSKYETLEVQHKDKQNQKAKTLLSNYNFYRRYIPSQKALNLTIFCRHKDCYP